MRTNATEAARFLLTRTVATDLAAALAALHMQEESRATARLADEGRTTEALRHAISSLSKKEPTLALDGMTEAHTHRFLQCLRMARTLTEAAHHLEQNPLRAAQLVSFAWTHLPLITPPGATAARARHYVNCYTVDTAFAGAPENGWYHTRYTYTGTIAATQTLAAAREIQSLMQAKVNSHHEQSQNRTFPYSQPVPEIRIESHPGRSGPPDRPQQT